MSIAIYDIFIGPNLIWRVYFMMMTTMIVCAVCPGPLSIAIVRCYYFVLLKHGRLQLQWAERLTWLSIL